MGSVGSEHPDYNRESRGSNQQGSMKYRAISSVGSERLPYKQEVDGSNPSSPTKSLTTIECCGAFFVSLEYVLFKWIYFFFMKGVILNIYVNYFFIGYCKVISWNISVFCMSFYRKDFL